MAKPQPEKEIYSRFISSLRLNSVIVTEAKFERRWFDILPEKRPVFEANQTQIPGAWVAVDDRFDMKFGVSIEGFYEEDLGKRGDILSLQFVLQLSYEIETTFIETWKKQDKDSFLALFSRRNLMLQAWPYAREFVSSTTMRMGFPPIVLDPQVAIPQ